MKSNHFFRSMLLVIWVLILMIPLQTSAGLKTSRLLKKITLPPGFKIEVYAEKVPNARSMTLSPNGILFVGTRKKGDVYAVIDQDKDQKADKVVTSDTVSSLVNLEGNQAISYKPFARGWKIKENNWGRPVDLLVMPDGALLVSDDYNDAIYRISYQEPVDN